MSEAKTAIAQALYDYGSGGASSDLEDVFANICVDQANKVIAALDAAGFAIVPKVATEAMIDAHDMAHARAINVFAHPRDVWSAMLSAAGAKT